MANERHVSFELLSVFFPFIVKVNLALCLILNNRTEGIMTVHFSGHGHCWRSVWCWKDVFATGELACLPACRRLLFPYVFPHDRLERLSSLPLQPPLFASLLVGRFARVPRSCNSGLAIKMVPAIMLKLELYRTPR